MVAADQFQLTYATLLQDPRWQAKRQEVLTRAHWQCEDCGVGGSLDVHHRVYSRGHEPWDYPDSVFVACCRPCHKIREEVASLGRIVFQMADPVVAKTFLMSLAMCQGSLSEVLVRLSDGVSRGDRHG